jgi:hypothetical protein
MIFATHSLRLQPDLQDPRVLKQRGVRNGHGQEHRLAGGPGSPPGPLEAVVDLLEDALHPARNRLSFLGNSRNRYACEMPAARAMSRVGMPYRPWVPPRSHPH